VTLEIIHIGFPKTATTTLQEHLFARHEGLSNIARPFSDDRKSKICTALALGDDDEYADAVMSELVEQARSAAPRLMLYSDETVVNSPIRAIAAKRLKGLFPEARVLAVIRNQLDAFASYYAAHGRKLRPAPEPYSGRFVSFENYVSFNHENPKRGFLPTLHYDAILRLYGELFDTERIHVLMFEEFQQDRPAFMTKLAEILGIDGQEALKLVSAGHKRARPVTSQVRYDAYRNNFLRDVPLSRIVPGSRHLKKILIRVLGNEPLEVTYPAGWDVKIADMFREGNRALRDRYDLPLEHFGYPL